MGILSSNFFKGVLDDIQNSIENQDTFYYLTAINSSSNSSVITENSYDYNFNTVWNMLFGKKISFTDIAPMIQNNTWASNTIYNRYDNTIADNDNFYIVSTPVVPGADYLVYKCIDNANGSPSQYMPNIVQANTFYTADNYGWRYMFSISNSNYQKFSTGNLVPVFVNNSLSMVSSNNTGLDVIVISNTGIGYDSNHDGVVQSVNSNIIQISANASSSNFFYNNNAIYLYPPTELSPTTSQLLNVINYISNTSGNWIYTDSVPDSNLIVPNVTMYKISPAVLFDTDGIEQPTAYTVVDPTVNAISEIVILQNGTNISRANVSIQSNTGYGTGVNAYAIVGPPGGHGSNPTAELGYQGSCFSVVFNKTEANTIPVNVNYNRIAIIKDPFFAGGNTNTESSNNYNLLTFSQILVGNVTSTYNTGDYIRGQTSNALGRVAFSNSTVIYMTGDQYFLNNETIYSVSNTINTTNLHILSVGAIYEKDIVPLYVENINNVTRTVNNSEIFKILINTQ